MNNSDSVREVAERMRDAVNGVQVRERKWMFHRYPSCFVGADAVDWLCANEPSLVGDRAAAVALGLEMQAAGLLHHVTRDHFFKDEFLFYCFAAEADGTSWAELVAPMGAMLGIEDYTPSDATSTPVRPDALSNMVLDVVQSLKVEPLDEHNLKLLDNVHPHSWSSPEPTSRYNLVVVGAGTAGLVSAIAAAGLGCKVALVERHLMGGDCLNTGCVPSKALLACARRVHQVRHAHELGVHIEGKVSVDFGAIMERMRRLRAEISWNDGAPRFAQHLGVDVFFGHAHFADARSLIVDSEHGGVAHVLQFSRAVICTGARAAVPNIAGLVGTPFMTNETLFNLTQLPIALLVIGGGVVACEMGQAFARFGSIVTILMRGERLLNREDIAAEELLRAQLVQDGVHVVGQCDFLRVDHIDGEFSVHTKSGVYRAPHLLCATGRVPNVENMGLELAGVRFDPHRGIHVNDQLQTAAAQIFAAGDCCSAYKFTHAADFQARIVLRNALFFGRARASTLVIPWCTYTEPEIAHVGLYEDSEGAPELDIFQAEFSENDRSICEGDTVGFVKVLVEKNTDRICGATIVGSNAGDMIAELTLCMVHGIGLAKLASVIHSYPTRAMSVRSLCDSYNRTKLTPAVKVLFRKFLAARRR